MFAWLRQRRRERLVQTRPISADAWRRTTERLVILDGLKEDECSRLRQLTTVFMNEKQFELTQGLTLDENQKVLVSVQACLPILELGLDCYNDWKTLILTPGEFLESEPEIDGYLRKDDPTPLGGEVLELGPVVLSWSDVEDSGLGRGYNVVIHEMAHKLDLANGAYDGAPVLETIDPQVWKTALSAAFADFRRKVERLGHRAERVLRLDPYAATDPAEFFAVLSETFFERPDHLYGDYPDVYGLFKLFYRQDTLERFQKWRKK